MCTESIKNALTVSGGIGSIAEAYPNLYGILVSAILPFSKILLGIYGWIVYWVVNKNPTDGTNYADDITTTADPNDNTLPASALLAAAMYLIIEGINQFTDEYTNALLESDLDSNNNHTTNSDEKNTWSNYCCLSIFQIIYTSLAIVPFYFAAKALSDEEEQTLDDYGVLVFVLVLAYDCLINYCESLMICLCKCCYTKTKPCPCCDGPCGYCCIRGGGLSVISERNPIYGFFTSTIGPIYKIILGLCLIILGSTKDDFTNFDMWNVDDAGRSAFIAGTCYIILDGLNTFKDQRLEGLIKNKKRVTLSLIVQFIYTVVMVYPAIHAIGAINAKDTNEFDKAANITFSILLILEILINLIETGLMVFCRDEIENNSDNNAGAKTSEDYGL